MAVTAVAGINGLIYLSGSELEGANAWSMSIDHETAEYRKFGDSWTNNVSVINSFSGSIATTHDQDTKQLQDAATAGASVACLIYPNRSDLTTYYNFSALFSAGHDADSSSVISQSADFTGDGTLTMTGFS